MVIPKNILVVEDEAITQHYIRDILLATGVKHIYTSDNAHSAQEYIQTRHIDLILMDININGAIDGITLAQNILANHTLPIVFISAYSDDATLEDVLSLSPYGFIIKPFSSQDVITTIRIAYKRFLTQHNNQVHNHTSIPIDHKYSYIQKTATLLANGTPISLNANQTKLLTVLIKNINSTVSFDELEASIWGDEPIANSSLRTLVYSLRKLLPDLNIHTYSKVGYALLQEDFDKN